MPDRSGVVAEGAVNVVSPGAYVVSDVRGDIAASGEGLFYRDTRHLSRFVMTVDGALPVARGMGSRGVLAEFELDVDLSGKRLRVTRRRSLGGGMLDEILFANVSQAAIEVVVSIECAADFEDIYAVRDYARASERGRLEETAGDGCLRYSYRRGEFRRGTIARVLGARPEYGPGRILFRLRLGPGETKMVSVSVTLEEAGEEVRVGERAPLYARAPGLETGWRALRRSWARSVEDLESLTFDAGDGLLVPAAGAPWFMALFGRDSLITAYGTMILTPEPAKNVLRALARHQATERDDFTDAEPGKIAHELRRGELAFFAETPETPYYGTADATPLFLVLLHEVWRWTADDAFIRQMEGPARSALAWILDHSDKVNGHVAYEKRSSRGLRNQSWKDSDDSMLFRDGARAGGRIAPVEVQGYVYDALSRTAGLAEKVWSDKALAEKLRSEAADLKARFERDFWLEDRGYYALALDGNGRRVDSITSNPGHLLWSGIASPDRARLVADRLLDETMFSGWGIKTMAEGEGGHDPDSYHNGSVWPHDNALIVAGLRRYGFREEANRIAGALIEAAGRFDHRLPEVFGGHRRERGAGPVEYPTSCSPQAWAAGAAPLLVRAMLGMEPDPEPRILTSEPVLPEGVKVLRLDGVPAFGDRFSFGG